MNKSNFFLFSIISLSAFSCSAMEPENDFGIITIISKTADPIFKAVIGRSNPWKMDSSTVQQRYKKNLDSFNRNVENFKNTTESACFSSADVRKKQLQTGMAKDLESLKPTVQWIVDTINKEQNSSNKESLGITLFNTVIDECKADGVLDLETLTAYQKAINNAALFYIEDERINFYNNSTACFNEMLNASNLLSASEKTLIATPGLLDLLNKKKTEEAEKKRKSEEALARLEQEQQEKEARKQQALAEKARREAEAKEILAKVEEEYKIKNVKALAEKARQEEATRLAKEEAQVKLMMQYMQLKKEEEEQQEREELARLEEKEKQQETNMGSQDETKQLELAPQENFLIPTFINDTRPIKKYDNTSYSIENDIVTLNYKDGAVKVDILTFNSSPTVDYESEDKSTIIRLHHLQGVIDDVSRLRPEVHQKRKEARTAKAQQEEKEKKEQDKPRSKLPNKFKTTDTSAQPKKNKTTSYKTPLYIFTGVTAGIVAYIAYLYHNNQLDTQVSHVMNFINNLISKTKSKIDTLIA